MCWHYLLYWGVGTVGGDGGRRRQPPAWEVLFKMAGICGHEPGLASSPVRLATTAKGSRSWMLRRFRASELPGATGGSGPRDRDSASGGLDGRSGRCMGHYGRQTSRREAGGMEGEGEREER